VPFSQPDWCYQAALNDRRDGKSLGKTENGLKGKTVIYIISRHDISNFT